MVAPPRYTHLVFDVDGTLVDTEAAVVDAYRRLAEFYGLASRSYDFLRDLCFIKTPVEALKNLGFTGDPAEALPLLDQYTYQSPDIRIFPGIPDLLETLERQGFTLSICTARNASEFDCDPVFPAIAAHFPERMCADYAALPKPAPDPLLRYCRLHNLARTQVLFIGDSATDQACAAAAGIDFALALWSPSANDALPAEYRFTDPAQVPVLLGAPQI